MSFDRDYNDPMLSSDDDSEYTVACTPIEECPRVSIHSGDEDEDDQYLHKSRMMDALREAMGIPASAVKHESHLIEELHGAYRIVTVHSFQRPPTDVDADDDNCDSPVEVEEVPSLSILQLDNDRARAIADDLAIERFIHRARVDELQASTLDLERAISDVQMSMQLLARAKVAETRELAVRLDQVYDHLRVLWGLFYNVSVAVAENRERMREQLVYMLEGERLLEELSVRKGKALPDYNAAKWWKDQEEEYARRQIEAVATLRMRIQEMEQSIMAMQEKLRERHVFGRKANQHTKEVLDKREREVGEREKKVDERMPELDEVDARLTALEAVPILVVVPNANTVLEERIQYMDKIAEDLKVEIAELHVLLEPRRVLEQRREELLATLSAELFEGPKIKERYLELKEELKEKVEEMEEWGEMFRHNQAEYKLASANLLVLEEDCQAVQTRIEEVKEEKEDVESRAKDAVAAASTHKSGSTPTKKKTKNQVEKRNLALAAMLKDKQRAVADALEKLDEAREEEETVRSAVIREGREAKERIVALRKELSGLKGKVEQARRKVGVWEARVGVREDEEGV